MSHILTSESVTEGHSDKVCDFIADSILDACLARHPSSRVACEVLCKGDLVVLAGEITCKGAVDYEAIACGAVRAVGDVDSLESLHADGLRFQTNITPQALEIGESVDVGQEQDEDRVKDPVHLDRALWKRTKQKTVAKERDLRELVDQVLREYLGRKERNRGAR